MMQAVLLILTSIAMLEMSACVGATGGSSGGGPATGGNNSSVMVNPATHDFGKVPLQTLFRHDFTITNAGATDSTVSKVTVTGKGYNVSALTTNTALKAGSSTGFSIFFLCQGLGNQPGSVSVTTTADTAPLQISLTAVGVPPQGNGPDIEVTPTSVDFGNVTVGTRNTQTMRVTNSGNTELTISKISASGSGFSQSGLSIPLDLQPGQDTTFTASFKPAAAGHHSGSISLTSNASDSPLAIQLAGSGVTTNAMLAANPTSLDFGPVSIGTNTSQMVQLTNTGNINVAISSMKTAGAGFSASGAARATLAPNQSLDVTVNFDPAISGSVSGTLTVSSSAPTLQIALAGQGAGKMKPHTVSLSWEPSSSSAVIGYNVYRGTVSGGPYNRVNPAVESGTGYADHTILSGRAYFYVVTAVDASSVESAFSNQASVNVPNP
jgi:hypothetical protein